MKTCSASDLRMIEQLITVHSKKTKMQKAKGRGPPTAGGAKSWNWVKTMKVTHTSI